MRSCRTRNRLCVGLVVALAVHCVVLYGVVLPALQPRMHETSVHHVTLDLELASQPAVEQPQSSAETPVSDAADPGPQSDEPVTAVPKAPEPIQPSTRDTVPTRHALVLTRPGDWADFDESRATQSVSGAMRPVFAQQLAAARAAQQRRSLLQSRGVAREGLSVAAYNAIEGSTSNHLKTEAGCFSLLPATAGDVIGPTGLENRWWRTACKGTYQSPFDQAALAYDAMGRVIGEAAGR